MITPPPPDKRQGPSQKIKFSVRRQALRFTAVQIDDKRQFDRSRGRGVKNADAPRLDPTQNGVGAMRDQTPVPQGHDHAVVRDQSRAQSHQRKRERRFSRPRGAKNH